jgi:hypothetical protein
VPLLSPVFESRSADHNASVGTPPPRELVFEAVQRQRLVEVRGSQARPVKNVTFRGLTVRGWLSIPLWVALSLSAVCQRSPLPQRSMDRDSRLQFRDTATTLMEPHGMPSAGDWALHRGGALTLEGVVGAAIEQCNLTQIDGNGVSINGFARDVSVARSEMTFIGETAIALWGRTSQGVGGGNVSLPAGEGIDGLDGEQPRGTRIVGNYIREVGGVQKQVRSGEIVTGAAQQQSTEHAPPS